MSSSLNSTFINIIPKKDNHDTFSKFRPISLYNLIYKMVTKFNVERINPNLSDLVSKEQFGFLSSRKILDAIGVIPYVLIPNHM